MNTTKKSSSEKELLFSLENEKPATERLYGRRRGHPLRDRQQRLYDDYLPRIKFPQTALKEPASAFGQTPKEVWMEVGFGGGEHSIARHQANPEVGYIACEVFENGVCSLLSNLLDETDDEKSAPIPDMLRLWNEDARILIREFPDQSIDKLFLMFPDPWPKARHAKRRFVHPNRIPLLHRILRTGAHWHVASDDPTYQEWVLEVMGNQSYFEKILETTERPSDWPSTRYEQKAYQAGRQPIFWIFKRV
ncbi:tRNA (guanine(46)-N(7))-methyltransferase TrmB [Commensalibacter communis]|uniref:tRNA (guanine(46)-N(7))-methyltransferase TrmB n=1 Tax=Commensalibacter communis TaxID=2972786 RepID=UPI0022FF80CD|nr:tRNA (guanine(46)-N(7))-methyltransferase TrmB [Commensalibacter communis]CAI3936700.1 tRNA G46 N7-methylase TrmB (TrmB) (PDB:1YZH) (PUBMED:19373903 [Commensalibacter communis]CAI3941527.1 tRNA G46 N7-methylase TrmB (TrmB) (PDB:1YZH) (PUBMED:19373903 [Commensalibacter communis]